MFLTIMERLSSQWQQDMSVGVTHTQESASGSDTQSSEQKISWLRGRGAGLTALAKQGDRTINSSD